MINFISFPHMHTYISVIIILYTYKYIYFFLSKNKLIQFQNSHSRSRTISVSVGVPEHPQKVKPPLNLVGDVNGRIAIMVVSIRDIHISI